LVAATGNSEGILGLCLGRVDVLVAKAELAKLVLCMELTGWSCKRGGERSWSNKFRGNGLGSKCDWLRGWSKDRFRG